MNNSARFDILQRRVFAIVYCQLVNAMKFWVVVHRLWGKTVVSNMYFLAQITIYWRD